VKFGLTYKATLDLLNKIERMQEIIDGKEKDKQVLELETSLNLGQNRSFSQQHQNLTPTVTKNPQALIGAGVGFPTPPSSTSETLPSPINLSKQNKTNINYDSNPKPDSISKEMGKFQASITTKKTLIAIDDVLAPLAETRKALEQPIPTTATPQKQEDERIANAKRVPATPKKTIIQAQQESPSAKRFLNNQATPQEYQARL
jgi:hypothetical protein